ncbi:hypothetical protein PQX77_015841 [Marasmius sp. AFHP31]|nr:hypothetical protein PQX77_015841 [Marasmius sp. AFHP31]
MFFKLSTIPQLAVAAMLSAGVANAEQGWAVRDSTLGCCSAISLAYNGNNVIGTYTDICTGGCIDDPTGGPNDGLALSDPLYQALNPGGFGPIFVTWNNLGRSK